MLWTYRNYAAIHACRWTRDSRQNRIVCPPTQIYKVCVDHLEVCLYEQICKIFLVFVVNWHSMFWTETKLSTAMASHAEFFHEEPWSLCKEIYIVFTNNENRYENRNYLKINYKLPTCVHQVTLGAILSWEPIKSAISWNLWNATISLWKQLWYNASLLYLCAELLILLQFQTSFMNM